MANTRGGRRPGAGRPKGRKTNSNNALSKLLEGKATPLDVLQALLVKRTYSKSDRMRLEIAKAMAPYIHPRLSSAEVVQEVSGEVTQRVIRTEPEITDADEWQNKHAPKPSGNHSQGRSTH